MEIHVLLSKPCHQCGKHTDGLMTCTHSHDGSTIELCPDCIKDSGFCYGCGHYCSGTQDFDFSPMPNYCYECRQQIYSDFDELDNDDFEECSDCDGHDACSDFGCAIKAGIPINRFPL